MRRHHAAVAGRLLRRLLLLLVLAAAITLVVCGVVGFDRRLRRAEASLTRQARAAATRYARHMLDEPAPPVACRPSSAGLAYACDVVAHGRPVALLCESGACVMRTGGQERRQ